MLSKILSSEPYSNFHSSIFNILNNFQCQMICRDIYAITVRSVFFRSRQGSIFIILQVKGIKSGVSILIPRLYSFYFEHNVLIKRRNQEFTMHVMFYDCFEDLLDSGCTIVSRLQLLCLRAFHFYINEHQPLE